MVFQCINIRQVPWEVLKTTAFVLGFQHLPRDLANVNAWKTMFDPYINSSSVWKFIYHLSVEPLANENLCIHTLTWQNLSVWECNKNG